MADRASAVSNWERTSPRVSSATIRSKKGRTAHVNNVELGRHGRWRSNVWTYPGASSLGSDARKGLRSHPTVKPTAMLEDALLDLTHRDDIVLDRIRASGHETASIGPDTWLAAPSDRHSPPRSCPLGPLAPRLRHDPQVRPGRLPALGINALRLVVSDRAGDDHVLAVPPVHRRRDSVLGGELQ